MRQRDYLFEHEFLVRDSELDIQGVVNNANYQKYLEHARHRFLKRAGYDFASLHAEGILPVVTRIEMDYISPLRSDDSFVVRLDFRMKGRFRMVFDQWILKLPEFEPVVNAVVTGAVLQNSRPVPVPKDIIAACETLRSKGDS